MILHGRSIEWYSRHGLTSYSVEGCATRQEAFETVVDCALNAGWRPPKWWQFWRWSEPFWNWPKDEREEARSRVTRG